MEKSEKLLTARVAIGLIGIAVVTLAFLVFHEYGDQLYQQIEQVLAQSMHGLDNTLAGN